MRKIIKVLVNLISFLEYISQEMQYIINCLAPTGLNYKIGDFKKKLSLKKKTLQ